MDVRGASTFIQREIFSFPIIVFLKSSIYQWLFCAWEVGASIDQLLFFASFRFPIRIIPRNVLDFHWKHSTRVMPTVGLCSVANFEWRRQWSVVENLDLLVLETRFRMASNIAALKRKGGCCQFNAQGSYLRRLSLAVLLPLSLSSSARALGLLDRALSNHGIWVAGDDPFAWFGVGVLAKIGDMIICTALRHCPILEPKSR